MTKLEAHVRAILNGLGHDSGREGLKETPRRFLKFLREFSPEGQEKFNFTTFSSEGYDEMIVVGPIPFGSLCEHHLAPFFGHGFIGYIPTTKIVGLSKLPRVLTFHSRQLQNQERLTHQVCDFLFQELKPRGVGVVLKAEHTCMCVRGVRMSGVQTRTVALRGVFKSDSATRAEFFAQAKA